MTRYISMFYDPGLEIPAKSNREQIEGEQIDRIARALSVVLVAGSIPRRLGVDAIDVDLAMDKKRTRRTAYALNQALKGWTKVTVTPPLDDEIRREGAQLDWEQFKVDHLLLLNNHARLAVTWAIRNGEEAWAKGATVRFNNETNWFTYALRD